MDRTQPQAMNDPGTDSPDAEGQWARGADYDPYIGRWSRLVAREFLPWLALPNGLTWIDVGTGTGSLYQAIHETMSPRYVVGVDTSLDYVEYARERVRPASAFLAVSDARALPFDDSSIDAAVSGLVLNFVPDPKFAVKEMARVVRKGGTLGAYVWDYAGEMQLLRNFWEAAGELDPAALELDEGARFDICRPEHFERLFRNNAALWNPELRAIDVPTVFRDFDDYWEPFLGGQGPAPHYLMSLSERRRAALRDLLRSRLPSNPDSSISLKAQAWAVRVTRV